VACCLIIWSDQLIWNVSEIVCKWPSRTTNTTAGNVHITYTESRSRYYYCCAKSLLHIMTVFVALVIQLAKLMRRVILSTLACPGVPYFSTLSHKWHNFRKEVFFYIKCVLIFSTKFFWNVSIRKIRRDVCQNICVGLYLILSDFNQTWVFSTDFRKTSKYQISWNPSSGSRVVPCEQTDMTKLIVAFHNLLTAPKIHNIK
jgi:hypothetical protein